MLFYLFFFILRYWLREFKFTCAAYLWVCWQNWAQNKFISWKGISEEATDGVFLRFACSSITPPTFPVATSPAQIHVDKEPLPIILIKKSDWSATPFTVHGHSLHLFHGVQLTEVLKTRFLCSFFVDSKAFMKKTNPCGFNVRHYYPCRTVCWNLHCSAPIYKAKKKLGCRNLKVVQFQFSL